MSTSTTTRILYLWHLIDGIVHLTFESTYVYNCFTYYIKVPTIAPYPYTHLATQPQRFFLGYSDRLYGNAYANNIFAPLWMNYAEADSRYSGIDFTTLSLEIITVFLAGPLALYVAERVRREVREREKGKAIISGATWFWAMVLASAELYGGLMNFLPEWLSGCESLDTDDAVHFWFHIVFFNAIWIFFPIWVLRKAYSAIGSMSIELSDRRKSEGLGLAKNSASRGQKSE